jgi:hypothetical protein
MDQVRFCRGGAASLLRACLCVAARRWVPRHDEERGADTRALAGTNTSFRAHTNTTAGGWVRQHERFLELSTVTESAAAGRTGIEVAISQGKGDRDAHGDERVGKVALRPRPRAHGWRTSGWPRGGKSASARRHRRHCNIRLARRGGATRETICLRSDRDRALL